ncbi:uncharacterized protein LOC8056452 [Sorghum bicolor]|uniref:uncharacterized protein LOC8056452 n=1 Tax=Sorghum bicolor TaxID=4558 RepID=UPI000B4239E2|nr:uncharacterized protein LOC8056452 [Sorghum bicolor]|eukprot:XP_021315300.1 uncharacterized protein LOC8056452 [Sorghum bicolor]
MVKAWPTAAVESGGAGGVSTEAPRRSERLLQEIVGGSADDAEAEFSCAALFNLTAEERLPYFKRLYKKRANMALAWYNKNNPEGLYEFTSVVLNDIYNFMDGGLCYMHMNFKARNVTTRSEELFFAELALNKDVFDTNSGYSATACSIVDGNCVGGKKDLLGVDGLPVERYDEKNCYACAEKIKHPTGVTYSGGHYVEDYFADKMDRR